MRKGKGLGPRISQTYTISCVSLSLATCPNPGENNCLINGVYKCIHDPDKDCIEGVRSTMLFIASVMVLSFQDNCELVYNPDQKDMDRDGVGDACDNCKFYSNPNQENSDDDETGNECDADDDNDGVGK